MLADIQNAGGIGALKKVDRSQIRDRSQAQVGGGGEGGSAAPPPPPGAPGGAPNMADALAAALQKRKEKVSRSGKLWSQGIHAKNALDTDISQMTKTTTTIGKSSRMTERERSRARVCCDTHVYLTLPMLPTRWKMGRWFLIFL